MKKVFAVIVLFIFVFAFSATAFAVETYTIGTRVLGTGSVSVKKNGTTVYSGTSGETYNVAGFGTEMPIGLYLLTEGESVPTENFEIESEFKPILAGAGGYDFTMPNEAVTVVAVFDDYGDVPLIITGGTAGTDYTYENGVLEIKAAGTYEIKNADPATATDNIIKVSAPSGTVNITLSGVNIVTVQGMSVPAFEIIGDCTTNITLADNTENILNSYESKKDHLRNYAGLQNGEHPLTISCEHSEEAEHSCDNTCGSLEAVGGNHAACIGGGNGGNGNNITISGGTVTATGGLGAGIGGGNTGNGNNITISGGTVTATGGLGAGIGGGYEGNSSNIKIAPAANTEIIVNTGATASEAEELTYAFAKEEDITSLVSGNAYFYSETTEHNHFGGTATCTEKAVCQGCGTAYGNTLGHDWSGWNSNENGTHTRTCRNDASHTETANCSGGAATCTEKAVCQGCGTAYGNTLGHDWSGWNSNENGTHTRTCRNDASHTETANCSGGAATCTEKAVCKDCGFEHGDLAPENHGEHETEIKGVVSATCAEEGYTGNICCKGCGAVIEKGNSIPKKEHNYGGWVSIVEPTETEGGRKVKTCLDCGHKTSKYVKPLSEDGITVITPGEKNGEETNPNTGAPEFGIPVLGIVMLAVAATSKKRK